MDKLIDNTINVLSDDELEKLAVDEFKEDPDKIAEEVASLQEWIKTQPHFSSIRQDTQFKEDPDKIA